MTVVLTDKEIESFRQSACRDITLVPEGTDRYRVFSPFMFPDGDHVALVLKREDSGWVLSDEGHTMMHLSYRMEDQDPHSEKRKEIINDIYAEHGIEERKGEFICLVQDEQCGDDVVRMAEGLMKLYSGASLFPDIKVEKIEKPGFNWAGGLADVQDDVFSLQKKSLIWRDTDEMSE